MTLDWLDELMSSGDGSVGHDFNVLGLILDFVIRLIHFVLGVAIIDVVIQLNSE